ncbi:MAG: DUF5693 family protein [Candidatus Eremiobacteraeota bacterium]|nr:DUF5693 family protein [Candidatus Eremiobacteraeota bacterium]
MQASLVRRLALYAVIAGAIAALLVAIDRYRFEVKNRTVEIAMDQQDLADFAHSYGYDINELMRAMRRAGLTAVAVYEEQGQRVNSANHALALAGQQIIDNARLSPLGDPLLSSMVRTRAIDPNSVYLVVYDEPTLQRYVSVLRTQLEPHTVAVVRAKLPAIVAVKTQLDFFNGLGLGIPQDIADQVRANGLLVDPRVQNNERMDPNRIAATFDQMTQGGRIGTVIFFGPRNDVLGYPYNLDATADNLRAHKTINFGDVEAYSQDQIQKGSMTLARKIPSQTVRVQAISKVELDKLDLDVVLARYLLGVRERNIRVIYLRPFPHVIQRQEPGGTLVTESAEETNLDMLRRLREGLEQNGFRTGHASRFVDFKSLRLTLLYFIVALGAAGAFLLLLHIYGVAKLWMAWAFFGLTTAAFWLSALLGHDSIVRELWALGAALTFAVLAGTTLAPYFNRPAPSRGRSWRRDLRDGLVCMVRACSVATLGGLFVVGLLSQATFMLEVQQFVGIKLLLVAPPLVLIALYTFAPLFGAPRRPNEVAVAPLRVWQFAAVLVAATAAALLLMRSGNQPDIGVSGWETQLRGFLTWLLGVRPRFKEFLLGFPALMLLPALAVVHRRAAGWFIVIAAGIGLADVIDAFSHIHTPLLITLLRVALGLIFGLLIGIVAQRVYRAFFRDPSASR